MDAELVQKKVEVTAYLKSLCLPPGGKLPTEGQLCNKFKLNRYQIRKILGELGEEQGWIKVQGSGAYLPGGEKKLIPREKVIAWVVPYQPDLAPQLAAAQDIAMKAGFHFLYFGLLHERIEFEQECLRHLLQRRIHSLILEPNPGDPAIFQAVNELQKAGTRCILLNAPPELKSQYRVFDLNYHKAGYMAVVQLMRSGARQIIHIAQAHSIAWQHAEFKQGIEEAVRDFQLPLKRYEARLALGGKDFLFHWTPTDFELPLEENTGYINDDTPLAATWCYLQLRTAGVKNFSVVTTDRGQFNLPIPSLRFDNTRRLCDIVDMLVNSPAEMPTRQTYDPELQLNHSNVPSDILYYV